MPGFVKTLVMILIACGACVPAIAPTAYAAQAASIGAWRTTNECFLAAFVLTEGGRAQSAYLSGERDDNAAWTSTSRPCVYRKLDSAENGPDSCGVPDSARAAGRS